MEAQIAVERLLVRTDLDWALAGTPRWQKRNPTIRAHESLALARTDQSRPGRTHASDAALAPSR
jgi:hypothetical protein